MLFSFGGAFKAANEQCRETKRKWQRKMFGTTACKIGHTLATYVEHTAANVDLAVYRSPWAVY